MDPNSKRTSDQPQKPEIVRILIYIFITLLIDVAAFVLNRQFISIILDSSFGMASLLRIDLLDILFYSSMILVCIVQGLLYRRFVFRSKKSALPAIVVLVLLNVIENIINAILPSAVQDSLSAVFSLVIFALGYILQRFCLYADFDGSDAYKRMPSGKASDNDPQFLGVDLDDIDHRNTLLRRSGLGLFGHPDLDNHSERVITQSSRDAIRVMEHKELGIKHEWNCDDRANSLQSPGRNAQHVIAPGNNQAIHVTEHNALDMKHEWNCDDQEEHR